MKDNATRIVEEYIKKRKQIFSITLEQELWDDAIQVANQKHEGNFSKCVAVALEKYIDQCIADGLAITDQK
jgi:hypothetical protein